jgi:hypothetical protein
MIPATGVQYNPRVFLQWFATLDLESAEVVWNGETRREMKEAIERGGEYFDEYSVQRRELRVDGIYIRYYNQERDRYRPYNALRFAQAIILKIKEYVGGKLIAELSEE